MKAVRDMKEEINLKENGENGKEYLHNLEREDNAVIDYVPDHSLLAPLGVRPGKEVKVKTKQPFKGPIVLEIEGRQIAIDRNLAAKIIVYPGADEDGGF